MMVQVPIDTKVRSPAGLIVQTAVVDDVKLTVRPESELADRVGVVPKLCAPGLAKVIVWIVRGVTALEAADAGPGPALFSATTVNV